MKRIGFWRLKNINALLIIVVVIISIGVLAFIGMTIINTDHLATYTSEIYHQSYIVNNAAWQMRNQILFARNTMLNLLLDDTYETRSEKELNILYSMREELPQIEQTLQTKYEGNQETVTQLIEEVKQLEKIHDQCIQLVREGKTQEAGEILYGSAYPLYLSAEKHVEELTNYSQNRIDEYVNQAYALNEKINRMACAWGGVLIALAVLLSVVSVRTIMKRNEDIMRDNMLFKIISDNIDDVFVIYDTVKKQVEYISENAERILGFSLQKGKSIARKYLDEQTFERLRTNFLNETSSEAWEEQFRMKDTKTGIEREMVCRRYPIEENGQITRAVFVTSDLTDQKRAQNVLRAALEKAEHGNAAKREFLSRMSHEIRNPMNAMMGTIRAMGYDMDQREKLTEHLRKLNISANHLLDLINDILDMSRIESGKARIESRPFSLDAMLSEIADIMHARAEENQQEFNVLTRNISCDIVRGDDTRIKQVLLNFLSNAIKFTPSNGKIKLSVEEVERKGSQVCVRFEVQDTGIGMHPEFLEHLFEPFEQEDSSTYRKFGGTGLGMALSKALVESMGGKIEVESEPNKGSKFSFMIWLEAGEISIQENVLPDEGKKLRALIVEDEEAMRTHLALQCRQLGIDTVGVSSAVDAVKTIRGQKRHFDFCLIDLYMPDIDGIRTAEWLRTEAGSDMFIVLMSAYDYKKIEQEATQAGVDAFLMKPVMQADIYRVLQGMHKEVVQEEKAGKEEYDFRGKRLLIAEDNEINREVAKELCEYAGFTVESARNGQEAVELFQKSPEGYYNAILMDVHMPIMNGNEAARTIRKLDRPDAKKIIIIAMTANAFPEDEEETLRCGMNAHVAKPIEPEKIFQLLQNFWKNGFRGE